MRAAPIEESSQSGLVQYLLGIFLATVAWVLAYSQLTAFAHWIVELLGRSRVTHFGDAVHFFLYDTLKVLLLLKSTVLPCQAHE